VHITREPIPTFLAHLLSEDVECLRRGATPMEIADYHDALLVLDAAVQDAFAECRRAVPASTFGAGR
jgi:hypothetical protein